MKLLSKAFTLIELLIVIVIIGILVTTLIPRLKGLQDKARYTKVEKDFQDFRIVVFMAQSNTGKPLKDITGSACSACSCYPLDDTNYLPTKGNNDVCRTRWTTSLRNIEVAAGIYSGALGSMDRDPWGSPYLLDENEGEWGGGGCAYKDLMITLGKNGYNGGGDDRAFLLAPQGCPGSY